MKKLLYISLFCLVGLFVKGQNPTPSNGGYPIKQSIGSDSALVFSKGAFAGRVIIYSYADTATANTQRIKQYPGALIFTTDSSTLWMRNKYATAWIKTATGSASGNIVSFNFLTDSSVVICYGNGVCDTIPLYNFTNVVNTIIQNFNDSTVFHLNDSTIIICNGQGVCDTISLGSTNTFYFLNDSTIVTCDTTEIICIGDSCYQQQICDTIPVPKLVSTFYQNLEWKNGHLVETGDPLFGTQAQMYHDTYFNTYAYQLKVQGIPLQEPPFAIRQNQWTQNSASILELGHYGAYRPGWGLLDSSNVVNLYTNYTDPFIIPATGGLAGDTVGFMGNRYAYLIMTNSKGRQVNFGIDDMNAKQVGIALHTYGSDYDAVTIFGNQLPSAYNFGNNPASDSTLLDARIAVFKTNKEVQFPGYISGAFVTETPTTIAGWDSEGNFVQVDTSGIGGHTTILNDTTIVICSFGTNLCDTFIVHTGIFTVANGLTDSLGTGLLGGTLYKNTTITNNSYKLIVTGSGTRTMEVTSTNASGIPLYVTGLSSEAIHVESTGTQFLGISTTALTNSRQAVFEIGHNSSGTALAGFGLDFNFNLGSATIPDRPAATITTKWVTPTDATRTAQQDYYVVNSGTLNNIMSLYGSGVVGIGISSSYTATRLNVVDNSLAGTNMVDLTSTSTAAASGNQRMLNISLSGANATASQNTYGIYSVNSHTGTSPTNVAVYGEVNNGVPASTAIKGIAGNNQRGVWGDSQSGIGVLGTATSGTGGSFSVTSGNGALIAATTGVGATISSETGLPLYITQVPSSTNTIVEVVRVVRGTSGTPENGIGGAITYQNEASDNGAYQSAQIASTWTDKTVGTRTGDLQFWTTLSAVSTLSLTIAGDGSVKLRPITATAASAITPAEGMIVMVSSTDATFLSIGFWGYYNGAWHAL